MAGGSRSRLTLKAKRASAGLLAEAAGLMEVEHNPTCNTKNDGKDDAPRAPRVLHTAHVQAVGNGNHTWNKDQVADQTYSFQGVQPCWAAVVLDIDGGAKGQ